MNESELGHFQTSRRTLSMVRFTPESCRAVGQSRRQRRAEAV